MTKHEVIDDDPSQSVEIFTRRLVHAALKKALGPVLRKINEEAAKAADAARERAIEEAVNAATGIIQREIQPLIQEVKDTEARIDEKVAAADQRIEAALEKLERHEKMFAGFKRLEDIEGGEDDDSFLDDLDGGQDETGTDIAAAPQPAPAAVATEPRPSAEDLEAIAQRVFDRLHGLIQNGTLTLQAAQTRDDSVHLVTDPDFLDFVRTGTRGDVVSFELTPIAFNLIAVLDLLMAGQDREAGELLDKLLAHDTESFKEYCDAKVEKRMEAVG